VFGPLFSVRNFFRPRADFFCIGPCPPSCDLSVTAFLVTTRLRFFSGPPPPLSHPGFLTLVSGAAPYARLLGSSCFSPSQLLGRQLFCVIFSPLPWSLFGRKFVVPPPLFRALPWMAAGRYPDPPVDRGCLLRVEVMCPFFFLRHFLRQAFLHFLFLRSALWMPALFFPLVSSIAPWLRTFFVHASPR